MNYLYLGLHDQYLPAAAAMMHLNSLEQLPAQKSLLALEYFRPIKKADTGKLFWVGKDTLQRDVYIAFVNEHPDVFIRGVESLLGVCHLSLKEMHVAPCLLENPQIGTICRILQRIGMKKVADKIGLRVVRNRLADLIKHIQALA